MDRPKQRATCTARHYRSSYQGLVGFLGISLLLLFSGCAQLDQLMGKQADVGESAQPAQTAEPAPAAPAPPSRPVQAAEPVTKSAATKKTAEPYPPSAAKEPQALSPKPAHQTAPAEGMGKKPEPEMKKTEQDKALAETDQPKKDKKSRVASDKKSKKSPKPPTEDVFLPPIPLPSKPAAIGGSGG